MSRRDEGGVASVLALAFVGLLVVVTAVLGAGVALVATHRTAQAAADLAALAGAGSLQQGGDACGRAAEIAARDRSRLRACRVSGSRVEVVVVADTAHLPFGGLDLAARAVAGPVDDLAGPAWPAGAGGVTPTDGSRVVTDAGSAAGGP